MEKFNLRSKKGVELAFSRIVWIIILLVFFMFVALWYMGLRDKILSLISAFFG